jgi:hypothetical protein
MKDFIPTKEQIEESQRILKEGKNLSKEDLNKHNFIATGYKEIKLFNICSALHRKDFPVQTNIRKFSKDCHFLLFHEDSCRFWELKQKDKSIYFTEDDIQGNFNCGEGEGITETWKDYKPAYLYFGLKRFYFSKIEKAQFKSLESSNL